jgi:butyrate kinase
MVAHLGTNSFNLIEKMVQEGNEKAILLSDAFVFMLLRQ